MANAVSKRLERPGPKRILALDGGGIRGILSIQVLARIEALLRERTGNASLTLSDYFDLIGGTSTGAIIAAALSLGWPVQRLHDLYVKLGNSIFETQPFRRGLLRAKFSAEPLRKALKAEFGEIRLGGDELKTGLAVVAKRLDTGSPWIVHNNPRGPFYSAERHEGAEPNKDFLLRNVVRASTAAPHYFEPEEIRVARGVAGAFVDGGVSPHNNPALQLFMLAALEGHGYRWPLGENNLMVVSVGTGGQELALSTKKVMKMPAAGLAVRSLASLMNDASALNETLLQWLSRSPTARVIDSEMGDLANDVLGGGNPWLTYLRYDAWLDRMWLKGTLDMDVTDKQLDDLAKMDRPQSIDQLIQVGRRVGECLVAAKHFPATFDTV